MDIIIRRNYYFQSSYMKIIHTLVVVLVVTQNLGFPSLLKLLCILYTNFGWLCMTAV